MDRTPAETYDTFYVGLKTAVELSWELLSATQRVTRVRLALSDVLAHLRGLIEAMPDPQAAKDQWTALLALLQLRLGKPFEGMPPIPVEQQPDPEGTRGRHGSN